MTPFLKGLVIHWMHDSYLFRERSLRASALGGGLKAARPGDSDKVRRAWRTRSTFQRHMPRLHYRRKMTAFLVGDLSTDQVTRSALMLDVPLETNLRVPRFHGL